MGQDLTGRRVREGVRVKERMGEMGRGGTERVVERKREERRSLDGFAWLFRIVLFLLSPIRPQPTNQPPYLSIPSPFSFCRGRQAILDETMMCRAEPGRAGPAPLRTLMPPTRHDATRCNTKKRRDKTKKKKGNEGNRKIPTS